MPQPIKTSVIFEDLSARFQGTSTVGGSPATNEEKIIGTLTLSNFNDVAVVAGIRLHGWCSFTAGTNGVTATMRIRQTDASGTVIASTGANTVVATQIYALDALGADAAPGIGKYVLTLQIGSGSAVSTVSALHISATII